MSLPPGSHLGPYEVLHPIGAGGMGEIYLGRDPRLGRTVAIKVLPPAFATDPERLLRFEGEARLAGGLNHPNILTVHDVGSCDGSPYLVMEFLEGETLRARLKRGALPVATALDLAIQFARGLAAAHARGLVHRDLKPANLFITRDDRLKILDFGLAKQLPPPVSEPESQAPTREASGLTQEGLALGTVGYMSPEQVTGLPADARSDLFAFGLVLYEMLSGRQAFERASAIETLSATLKENPPELVSPLGPVPGSLQRLVSRCMEKDPRQRYPTTQALVHDLEALLDRPILSAERGWGGRLQGHLGAHPWALALAALVLVATGGGTLLTRTLPRPSAVPVSDVSGLVALPTRVLGTEPAAFLADAVPDTLSTLLTGVAGLDMKVPPSSIQVEKVKGDLGKIAEAYQVKHLLLTTVTTQGEALILNVKLVEIPSQRVRWAAQYEGQRATFNTLLREAADGVARVVDPDTRGLPTQGRTVPPAGPQLALKEGLHYTARYAAYNQMADFERAREAYGRALQADPDSAQALGELAYLWVFRSWQGAGDLPECIVQVERHAQRALALDPRTGIAWAALAQAEAGRRPSSLERRLEYAIRAANPKAIQPDFGAAIAGTSGGPILMTAAGRLAFERKPLEPLWGGMGAYGLTWQGRPKEALQLLERVLAVEPGFRFGLAAKAEALVGLGRLAEAEELLKRCEPLEQELTVDAELWRQVRFELAVAQRDKATANRLADRAARLWLKPGDEGLDLNAACTMPPGLVRMGRQEEALRMLEFAMRHLPCAEGYLWVLDHPDLRPLHGDPRYEQLRIQGKRDLALSLKALQAAWDRGELPPSFHSALADLRTLRDRAP